MIHKKFGPGDKIFAKVRGYPPWPARVEGVADETPTKMKYHIFFYGTNETAVCKAEELFPYLEFRDKYGKPLKKRGFNEALKHVDAELGLSPSIISPVSRTEKSTEDSDHEGNLVIDETPGGTSKKSVVKIQKSQTTPLLKKDTKSMKRKIDDSISEDTEQKKGRSSLKKGSQTSSDESFQTKSSEVTRSGRKVKPKRFPDQSDEFEVEQEENDAAKNSALVKSSKKSTHNTNQPDNSNNLEDGSEDTGDNMESDNSIDDVVLDPEFLNNGILVAHTPVGEEFRIKFDLVSNSPVFKNEAAKKEWEAKVLMDGKRLKAQIESGNKIPESIKKEIEKKYNAKLFENENSKSNEVADDKREKLSYLKIEAQLLDIDCRIKCSLTLKQADPTACLRTLDEMLELKLSPLMVKKHPQVVETVKKLRKYVGNTSVWDLSDSESNTFATKAGMIRAKADHVYNKIKALFLVPYNKSFWDAFSDSVTEFNNKTDHLSMEEIFSMTVDPCDQSSIKAEMASLEAVPDKLTE